MARLHTVDPLSALCTPDYIAQLESVAPHSFKISTVTRVKDNKEFNLTDFVTNGTKMRGRITKFTPMLNEDTGKVTMYVDNTWSGVGMVLEDLQHVDILPSRYQYGDKCAVKFNHIRVTDARIIGIHFKGTKTEYDLEIPISTDNNLTTRIYNVDSLICEDN